MTNFESQQKHLPCHLPETSFGAHLKKQADRGQYPLVYQPGCPEAAGDTNHQESRTEDLEVETNQGGGRLPPEFFGEKDQVTG